MSDLIKDYIYYSNFKLFFFEGKPVKPVTYLIVPYTTGSEKQKSCKFRELSHSSFFVILFVWHKLVAGLSRVTAVTFFNFLYLFTLLGRVKNFFGVVNIFIFFKKLLLVGLYFKLVSCYDTCYNNNALYLT